MPTTLVKSNVIPDSKKNLHSSYNLKYSLYGMTNFLGDFLSRWGAFKDENYSSQLLKPQSTWMLRATVEIKPVGSKHQCCQGQALPMAGTARLWSYASHRQLYVLPVIAGTDLLKDDSFFSWATLGKPARGPQFRKTNLSSTGTRAQTEWLFLLDQKSQLSHTWVWGLRWVISFVGLCEEDCRWG